MLSLEIPSPWCPVAAVDAGTPQLKVICLKDEPSVPFRAQPTCKYRIKIYFRALQSTHKWMWPIPLHKCLVFISEAKPPEASWV